jgi:formylglycine-generating enzyme required for sulfatase activity/tetratricopeptide (TPR) repeat protein
VGNSGSESGFDELLDRVMSGEGGDVEALVSGHPDLASSEIAELRSLARLFGSRPVSSDPHAPLPKLPVAGFKILKRLGAGSAGEVFLAREAGLDRDVALKILRPGLAFSAEASARFTREAQALARLSHPSIVGIFSFGEEAGVRWIAMEYVEGRGLDEVLAESAKAGPGGGFADILAWARDVARGLGAAHAAGVVHRDVKPSNIRIRPDGRAVLLDFGLAFARDVATLTETGAFRGSPRYASPEQVSPSARRVDARTDVYSLGVVLYEAVTGAPPYAADTTESLFAQILSGNALPPRRVKSSVPRELDTVVMTAMDPDPARRYADGSAFADDLDALLHIRDVIARPPGPIRRLKKLVRVHPKRALVAGALLLALLAAGTQALRRALGDRAIVQGEMRRAESSAAAGDFDSALAAVDRALGVSPGADRVEARRRELLSARDRARAAALVAAARERLGTYRVARERALRLATELETLQAEVARRPLDAEEAARQGRGDTGLAAARAQAEEAFHAIEQGVAAALALDPAAADAHETLADLHLERWREALAADDREALRRWRELVEAHDRAGRHAAEIAGLGRVTITVAGPPATLDLFRYLEEAEVVPGGSRRLVPVPFPPIETPVPPGTRALRIAHAVEGLEPDDVVFELGGQPVGGRCRIVAGKPPFEAGDVLLALDGEPLDDPGVLLCRVLEREKRAHSLTVLRGGAPATFEVDDVKALRLSLQTSEQLANAGGLAAKLWRAGRVVETTLPRRAGYRPTAAPLFLGAEAPVARLERDLDPGSWLVVARAPGRVTQRATFVVPRGGAVSVPVELPALERALSDFVHVPPGFATIEHGSKTEHVAVPGFWILDCEVSTSEYLEFLNSPECPESRKTIPSRPAEMHGPDFGLVWNQLSRDENGRLVAPHTTSLSPMNGVSADDAEAFVAWVNASARAAGSTTVFALPTDLELLRAACGDDARPFPYGRHFGPVWQKTAGARPSIFLQPGRSFPIDESPFGVFDLLGSQAEWCVPTTRARGEHFSSFGSSFQTWTVGRLQALNQFKRDARSSDFGFRLVVRDP